MLNSDKKIRKRRKEILKKTIKYVNENKEDFVEFLKDLDDPNTKTKRLVRSLLKQSLVLDTDINIMKYVLEYYRDCDMIENENDKLLINQMITKPEYIDPNYREPKQEWELMNVDIESKIDHLSKEKAKQLNKIPYLPDKK